MSADRESALPSGAVLDESGHMVLPATQRPDGSWRKPVRVRAGYTPMDEAVKYVSPSAARAEEAAKARPRAAGVLGAVYVEPAKKGDAGRSEPKPKQPPAEKKPKPAAATSAAVAARPAPAPAPTAAVTAPDTSGDKEGAAAAEDPAKKVRRLRKMLKEIAAVEEKQRSGVELNEDQKAKLSRKSAVESELAALEASGAEA